MLQEKVSDKTLQGDAITQAPAEEKGQTDPQPTEEPVVIKYDPKAIYQDPDNPGKTIDGNTLKTRTNLGNLASKFQSERDTAIARAKQLAEQVAERDQRLAALAKQAAAQGQEANTLATLKRLGIKPESQDTPAGGSDWSAGEEQPQLTQQQVLQELAGIEQRLTQKTVDEVKSTIEKYNQDNLLNQQSQENINRFVARARQADEAQLRSDLPDLPDADIGEIAKLTAAASGLNIAAALAAKEGDDSTADEAYIQAQARAAESRNLQVEAQKKQTIASAEKQREQETEMFGRGSAAFKEIEEMKPTYNKKEAERRRKKKIADAKEIEKTQKRLAAQ